MDWDGVGTFAMFLSTGAIGVGVIALKAYKAKLASRLELERLRRARTQPDDVAEQIQELEARVRQLTDRADFTERLLDGRGSESLGEAE